MSNEIEKRTDLAKAKGAIEVDSDGAIDEVALFERVVAIIENRKSRAGAYANREITLMYWEIGRDINSTVLDYKRGEYGKRILATLSQQLQLKYGKSFEYTKITRMIKFAEVFRMRKFLPHCRNN